jgi:hypothetical protein
MRRAWLGCVIVSSACTFGGGPLVGYGLKRGFFAGAEVRGGPIVQVALGYQSTARMMYVRGDVAADPVFVASNDPSSAVYQGTSGGGRIGIGRGWSLASEPSTLVFDLGGAAGRPFGQVVCGADEKAPYGGFDVFLDVRWVGELEAVLSPQLVGILPFCMPG